jgi:hypothetical protein
MRLPLPSAPFVISIFELSAVKTLGREFTHNNQQEFAATPKLSLKNWMIFLQSDPYPRGRQKSHGRITPIRRDQN